MKILKTVLAVVSITLAAASNAKSVEYVATDNSLESKLCVAAATASKARMSTKIKHSFSGLNQSVKYSKVANLIQCNGEEIADFAAQAGNYEVAEKLAKYTNKNVKIHDIAKKLNGEIVIKDV